jgi:hypothetical protein
MNTKTRHLILSIAVLIWVNALPYCSRLPVGTDWAAQYLPDKGFLVPGLILFHAMYSMPAIPLIWSLQRGMKPRMFWILALLVVSVLTWAFNKDYDLSTDAQAAIGLVIFPLLTMVAAFGVLALDNGLRPALRKSLGEKIAKHSGRGNYGPLERIPGFGELPETIRILITYALIFCAFWVCAYLVAP